MDRGDIELRVGHRNVVGSIALSPDGRTLVVDPAAEEVRPAWDRCGASSPEVIAWDARTGEESPSEPAGTSSPRPESGGGSATMSSPSMPRRPRSAPLRLPIQVRRGTPGKSAS